jgi:hypothetical protein
MFDVYVEFENLFRFPLKLHDQFVNAFDIQTGNGW